MDSKLNIVEQLILALELAHQGLKWYVDAIPGCNTDQDFEVLEGIEGVLAKAKALETMPAVPSEYKLIHRELTQRMLDAALDAPAYGHPETAVPKFSDQFRAAWKAAPTVRLLRDAGQDLVVTSQ